MIYSSEKNLKINEVKEIISTIENEISKLLAEIKKDKDKSKDCKDSRGHSEKCNNIGVLETSKIKKLVSEKEIYEKILKAKISKKEPSQTQNLNDFQKGILAAENEDYREANELFEKFIKENPKDNKVSLAQYWYAETFRVMQMYTDATQAYLVHYQKYYKKEYAPQNLLKLGMMMIKIGEKDQGCKMINGVELQYPKTSIEILNRAKYEAFKLNCPNARFIEKISLDKRIDIEMLSKKNNIKIADKDANELEKERQKIAEEKKKIEEEKRKIAEAKKKQEEEDQKRKEANAKLYVIGSGTGFFVSSEGHVVSNDHVVGICRKVATKIEGKIINFNVINTDKVNDLGLIQGEYKSKNFLNIKSGGAEFGEDIVTFGYPLSDDLSDSVKLTRGIVSSLSGPGNNYSEIQIDAAIQPGNSGGPVLNMEGQVVGVASSGLNKITKLLDENSPYIPENVNFAVASPTLTNFLKANGVSVSNASLRISNTKELAKIGRPATLQLFCMNTKAVHEELKKTKKHSDVLLEKVIELR
jgi:tol-pal system protein YbgF